MIYTKGTQTQDTLDKRWAFNELSQIPQNPKLRNNKMVGDKTLATKKARQRKIQKYKPENKSGKKNKNHGEQNQELRERTRTGEQAQA